MNDYHGALLKLCNSNVWVEMPVETREYCTMILLKYSAGEEFDIVDFVGLYNRHVKFTQYAEGVIAFWFPYKYGTSQ